ncbi:MAG TPA: adenylate/guanylate cyclase domain-containing protein [Candidatus Angelobacter sp.]|jgi:adenylate cyclase|nr:adenylate/guanylate cyclase domain-containing protein [Candidatus Angelobacter sp.]
MARLIISSPDGKRGVLELTKPIFTVGRGNANDLVLNDAGVSRFHAVIKIRDDGIFVADRGSTNGVLVNGNRIEEESRLQGGDVLYLGQYELRLENVDERGIQVRKAEWPSTFNEIMHGRTGQVPPRPARIARSDFQEAPDELAYRVRKLERENYLLTVLYEAGKALNSKLSIDDISRQVITLASLIEGVERGFVMLFDDAGEMAHQSEVLYRNPPESGVQPQIILSNKVLESIRKERQPILIDDITADDRFSGSESMKISGLRSAMCAPLLGTNHLFGVLYVDNMEKAGAFTQEELNVFSLMAAQAGAAIDNALAHQKIAQQMEQRLALERFLSPEVAAMVAENPDIRLGGANQKVTVLFADIRGFTRLSETLPPERVVEILNEFFTRVTDVIFDFNGSVDKFMGDAVMAVFGAPISKGNDSSNAVEAAIQIQRLVLEMNRDAAARGWPELEVGVGINAGIAVAGNIGSPRRLDYTVIGDTVNTASRLIDCATGGQILISESVATELADKFKVEKLAALRVKGRTEPVQVFQVHWEVGKPVKKKRRPRKDASGTS